MVSCVAAGRPAYWIVFTYFVHWYHQMYLLFCLQHLTSVIVILMHDVNNALWKIMCHIFQPSFLFFLENKVVCSRFQILWKIRGHILVTFLSHLKKIAFYTDFLTSKVDLGFFFLASLVYNTPKQLFQSKGPVYFEAMGDVKWGKIIFLFVIILLYNRYNFSSFHVHVSHGFKVNMLIQCRK